MDYDVGLRAVPGINHADASSDAALPQQGAEFVINCLHDMGESAWLTALPDRRKELETIEGEWTLSASREVAVQIQEQDAMPGIATAEAPVETAVFAGSRPAADRPP